MSVANNNLSFFKTTTPTQLTATLLLLSRHKFSTFLWIESIMVALVHVNTLRISFVSFTTTTRQQHHHNLQLLFIHLLQKGEFRVRSGLASFSVTWMHVNRPRHSSFTTTQHNTTLRNATQPQLFLISSLAWLLQSILEQKTDWKPPQRDLIKSQGTIPCPRRQILGEHYLSYQNYHLCP